MFTLHSFQNRSVLHYPHHIDNDAKLLVYGDVHGNVMVLIYILMMMDVISLERRYYLKLLKIYQIHPEYLSTRQIEQWQDLMNKIIFKKNKITILLLGDILADRGMNDYFTLLLIAQCQTNGISFKITLSNHDLVFINIVERKLDWNVTWMPKAYIKSVYNMHQLCMNQPAINEALQSLYQQFYAPCLQLLSIENINHQCYIFSHAPIDLNIIQYASDLLGVSYQDNTQELLANTINLINTEIHEYATSQMLHSCFDFNKMAQLANHHPVDEDNALEAFVWNRHYGCLNRTPFHQDFDLYFAHGHDHLGPLQHHVLYLDTDFGKGDLTHAAECRILSKDDEAMVIDPEVPD